MARVQTSAFAQFDFTQAITEIHEWIQAAESTGRNIRYGLDVLATILAYTNLGIAQEMSFGVYDPRQTAPEWSYKIPVRRITSRYFKGWKVQRLAPGVWALVNNSREAYFIEFGINHIGHTRVITHKGGRTYLRHPRRIRRPIQKMSLMRTLKHVDETDVAGKVWSATFAPFRPGREFSGRDELIALGNIQSYGSGMRFI